MLNLSDRSISSVINSDMTYVYHVATSGDKLYYTYCDKLWFTWYNTMGIQKWTCYTVSLGISVDNDRNLYAVGLQSNSFVVISPDGQRHRQLLSSKDGLINPRVLDYDTSTNRLLVVNASGTAFLFDINVRQ